uniref:Protein-tyrosine-phosphatase n=1 Tax=Rhabditophanes sp. KR3021 TaxID=114890 RepID=A0AC35U7C9_9BILA
MLGSTISTNLINSQTSTTGLSSFACQIPVICGKELLELIDFVVILDCRSDEVVNNTFINGAHLIRLPSVFMRRLNNGSIAPHSICSVLKDAAESRVVVVPDSLSDDSVAVKVMTNLINNKFEVCYLGDNVQSVLYHYPQLSSAQNHDNFERVSTGNNKGSSKFVGNLNLSALKGRDDVSSDERRLLELHETYKYYPAACFPVQVLHHLYLGNAETAANKELLDRHNIRYIINVTKDLRNVFEREPDFHYYNIPVDDTHSQNLKTEFYQAFQFINQAQAEGYNVLVHCLAGISRSVTICLAYIMYSRHMYLEDAFDLLFKQNGAIAPNFHFMGQLTEFEKELFGDIQKTPQRLMNMIGSNEHGISQTPSSSCSTNSAHSAVSNVSSSSMNER